MFEQLFFPVILILTGILMKNTKDINSWIGYRTVSSMKNITNWRYAQRKSGNLFILIGLLILITTQLILWINPNFAHLHAVAFILFAIGTIYLFIVVERGLKNLSQSSTKKDKNE